jgi:hypothetical protein
VKVNFVSATDVEVLGTSTLTFNNDVTLGGNVTAAVDAGATVIFNSPVDLGANTLEKTGDGTMNVNNTVTGSGSVVGASGILGGIGTIEGDLIIGSAATVAPGEGIGTLSVGGDATVDGTLSVELAGADDYDLLEIAGDLNLTGTLDVGLVDLFEPENGDTFDILNFASVTGEFDTISLPGLGAGLGWDVSGL